MIHSLAQHVRLLTTQYLPSGKAFDAKHVVASNLRKLCEAICTEFVNAETTVEEFMQEMMPDTTDTYITHWERAVGIPDHCFKIASTIEDRRLNVKRKLSLLGLQTASDFESFATTIGLDIKVRSGIDHDATNGYGTELPDITFADAKTARFTIVVTSLTATNAFDYDFDFPFETAEQALMECVFRHAIPSNCQIVFTAE